MDVSYEDIKTRFENVRDFLVNDLNLLSSQIQGGNYIACLLIACACETLGRYMYGHNNGEQFFALKMLPEKWRPVAPSLFDAIRNGIAHGYETKCIRIGDKLLGIGITWRQQFHLSFSPDKKVLYLNIQSMARQITGLVREYEKLLMTDPKLRLEFRKAMQAKWTKKPVREELKAWQRLLETETYPPEKLTDDLSRSW